MIINDPYTRGFEVKCVAGSPRDEFAVGLFVHVQGGVEPVYITGPVARELAAALIHHAREVDRAFQKKMRMAQRAARRKGGAR